MTTTESGLRRRARGALRAAVLTSPAVLLTACSGGDEAPDQTPAQVLAGAGAALDETSGVTLSLSTTELPDGVDGVLSATGTATRAPAFEGVLTVLVNGLEVDVPVVSVDAVVFAKLPFTTEFAEVDPVDYGAPDPAQLMAPDNGLSAWLDSATGVEAGERVRDGEEVLRSYDGQLSGEVVDASIPSADEDAEFPVSFQVDDAGRLRAVEITGPFYGPEGVVDYTVSVDDYGSATDITAP